MNDTSTNPIPASPCVLAIDVGGTNIKFLTSGETERRKFPSGPAMTASQMCAQVLQQTSDWPFDVVSIGYPAPVVHGRPVAEPHNLGPGWVSFDFASALRRPVKIVNDAAMQAIGSYTEGRMLFLGLGTGLGAAMIVDDVLEPMELAHLRYRKRTYEDYVGKRGLERFGQRRWRFFVTDIVTQLQSALLPDYVVIGGGNARKLRELPANCRIGSNANAFVGGFRLWQRERPPAQQPLVAPA